MSLTNGSPISPEDLITRISQKHQVHGVLVIENPSGAIIRSTLDDDLSKTYASMFRAFLDSAQDVTKGIDEGDGLRLVRLRTKKHEIMMVPEEEFALVVIHGHATS